MIQPAGEDSKPGFERHRPGAQRSAGIVGARDRFPAALETPLTDRLLAGDGSQRGTRSPVRPLLSKAAHAVCEILKFQRSEKTANKPQNQDPLPLRTCPGKIQAGGLNLR